MVLTVRNLGGNWLVVGGHWRQGDSVYGQWKNFPHPSHHPSDGASGSYEIISMDLTYYLYALLSIILSNRDVVGRWGHGSFGHN